MIHQQITMPPLAQMMKCYCPRCSPSIPSWQSTFKNMLPQNASCLQSTLNNPSPPRSSLISFLERAITPWDQIQFKLWHMQEGVICVALPNLMAVQRVFNAVFLSHIFGMPAMIISCYAQKDQTFPTILWRTNSQSGIFYSYYRYVLSIRCNNMIYVDTI